MIKYNSITNHYDGKYIEQFREHFNQMYIVTEKVDGSNLQIEFTDGGMRIASKNNYIPFDDSFFSARSCVEKVFTPTLIEALKSYSTKGLSYTFYGEVFGPKIQRRVDY